MTLFDLFFETLHDGRQLLGIEDELFGEGHLGVGHDEGLDGDDGVRPHGLRGYSTLLSAIERGRTGALGDIVATIQAEQDEIIRSPQQGVLVVQGGPGTGKTVVALHRAAYLLYTHRFPLEDQGVLVIGPNRVFLQRYEDLVGDFETTVSRLCDFLGLTFEQQMHKFHEADHAQQLAVKGGPRENLSRPLMTENFRKYRKGLSRGQVKIVEAYNGDLMDRFGYPREYTGLSKPGLFSTLRPQLTEPLERFVNRDMRPQYKFGNSRLKKQLDANVSPLCPPLWDD